MTQLVWDQVGDRLFETGVDHGVIYLLDGSAHPWNGLASITETLTREVKSYHLDGVKYLDRHIPGSYAAKVQAYTYPDVMDALLGTVDFAPGVRLHDQRASLFHLSYRTLVGNDLEGTEHGYKIHIVYNVLASPSDFSHDTQSDTPSLAPFEWNLTGTPPKTFAVRPTAHISLDSRSIDSELLTQLEAMLYGTEDDDPALLGFNDLLELVEA